MSYIEDPKRFKGFLFNKENLDKLSYDDIKYLRLYLIERSIDDYSRKVDELEVYLKIRYKEIEIDMYNEWTRKSKITKRVSKADGFYDDFYHDEVKNVYFTELEMDTYKLLSEIALNHGLDVYYNKMVEVSKNKLGESKYEVY